jgi:N-acylneuraminate cytidylyltransferase
MKNIAIIPARGGSKRIPRKNIKPFLGKPIIAYSIEAALNTKLFDEIMVSTDDEEIADIAKQYGAKIPFMRSTENANDFASTEDVIEEVLKCYHKSDVSFEYACCIYPAAPFVSKEYLTKSNEILLKGSFDSVIPVLQFSYPILRAFKVVRNRIKMVWPENENKRSQDMDAYFHDAGQFYWINVNPFLKHKRLFNENTGFVELKEMEVQDIDNLSDWEMAEYKYTWLKAKINDKK